MPIQIKKQPRENSQSLTRRFSRRIQKSGILRRAKKNRFREESKSKQLRKRAALRKEELKKEYEELRKLGKVK